MKFEEWVDKQRGSETTRTSFLKQLSKTCGVSLQTLQYAAKGGRISLYNKAQAIADATDGDVSVSELCEK